MLGFADTAGFGAATFQLDGDDFELVAHPGRRRTADDAAVLRVLLALEQRDPGAMVAIAALGLQASDVELALRTGVMAVMHRPRPVAPLDPVEIIDLVALAI
jgi:hypothetical protein